MGDILCPYCKAAVSGGSDAVRCLKCSTRHHRGCWVEYGNHCSVFSCQGKFSGVRKQTRSNVILIIWCLANYAAHLSIRLIDEVTNSFPTSDLFIVVSLELILILTGLIALKIRAASDSVRTISLLLFSGNVLFVSLLFSHYVTYGFEQLNALVRL